MPWLSAELTALTGSNRTVILKILLNKPSLAQVMLDFYRVIFLLSHLAYYNAFLFCSAFHKRKI